MSSPENEYTSSWVSLPVAIKTNTQVESAEPLNLASETPTVFHGREVPVVSRDVVACSQWLRKEAARQEYAWRQRRRTAALLVTCSVRASWWCCWWLGLAPLGWWRRFGNWQREGRGRVRVARVLESFGARVAVRSVLEDHETAFLELECVVLSIENRISELEHKVVLINTMKAAFEQFRHATLSQWNDTKWQTLEEVDGKFKHLTEAVMLDLADTKSSTLNEVEARYGDWSLQHDQLM